MRHRFRPASLYVLVVSSWRHCQVSVRLLMYHQGIIQAGLGKLPAAHGRRKHLMKLFATLLKCHTLTLESQRWCHHCTEFDQLSSGFCGRGKVFTCGTISSPQRVFIPSVARPAEMRFRLWSIWCQPGILCFLTYDSRTPEVTDVGQMDPKIEQFSFFK